MVEDPLDPKGLNLDWVGLVFFFLLHVGLEKLFVDVLAGRGCHFYDGAVQTVFRSKDKLLLHDLCLHRELVEVVDEAFLLYNLLEDGNVVSGGVVVQLGKPF